MDEFKIRLLGYCMCLVIVLGFDEYKVRGEPQVVPCFFVFGDSLVDNGNNNKIASLARANYLPYGIDFPAGPTGRFSNGKSTVDIIAELLGFDEYIPSFASVWDREILKGVNYASAAAGIRDETGRQLGANISFRRQLENHKNAVSRIEEFLGSKADAAKHLRECIYSVGMGSNDYLNNYFMSSYPTRRQYSPEQYAASLVNDYFKLLKILYELGARKIAVTGIGQIGCSPYVLARNSLDGKTCVESINTDVQIFNKKLKSLVKRMNKSLLDAKFIYIDAYSIFQDLIDHPLSFGLKVTNSGCCGVGRNNGQITCLPFETTCRNREEYLFWDAFHPTEAVNMVVANRSFSSESSDDAYPMDICRLAHLEISNGINLNQTLI